jgi:hypothetical protein
MHKHHMQWAHDRYGILHVIYKIWLKFSHYNPRARIVVFILFRFPYCIFLMICDVKVEIIFLVK